MRPSLTAVVVVIGVLLLADFLVVNDSLEELAGIAVEAAILVAAGTALAAGAALGVRRLGDLWRRRGDPVGAAFVLGGLAAMLVAGLRPGTDGASDPAVRWLVVALLVPIAATLFGVLFVSTLGAARRAATVRGPQPIVMVGVAVVTLVLLLPLGGAVGTWLGGAATWTLDLPVGAVFRGLLIGVALLAAAFAARTLLGIGSADE